MSSIQKSACVLERNMSSDHSTNDGMILLMFFRDFLRSAILNILLIVIKV